MKLATLLIAGSLCVTPAWAQEGGGGVDPSNEDSALVLQQNAAIASRALAAGDFTRARRYARTVTRGAPGRGEGWLMLGGAQAGLKDWKAAGRTYRTAVRLMPSSSDAHAGLGMALARSGDPAAAQQLSWLSAAAQNCGANCASIARQKSDVEAAMAEAAKGR